MGNTYIGSTNFNTVGKIKVGNTNVSKIYVGSNQVFPGLTGCASCGNGYTSYNYDNTICVSKSFATGIFSSGPAMSTNFTSIGTDGVRLFSTYGNYGYTGSILQYDRTIQRWNTLNSSSITNNSSSLEQSITICNLNFTSSTTLGLALVVNDYFRLLVDGNELINWTSASMGGPKAETFNYISLFSIPIQSSNPIITLKYQNIANTDTVFSFALFKNSINDYLTPSINLDYVYLTNVSSSVWDGKLTTGSGYVYNPCTSLSSSVSYSYCYPLGPTPTPTPIPTVTPTPTPTITATPTPTPTVDLSKQIYGRSQRTSVNVSVNVYVNGMNQKTITLLPSGPSALCSLRYQLSGSGNVELHLDVAAQNSNPSIRLGSVCGTGTPLSITAGTSSYAVGNQVAMNFS
jgi:hypothetical protein